MARRLNLAKKLEFFAVVLECMKIRTAMVTGLRLGELLWLSWGDVDFENKIINVNTRLKKNFLVIKLWQLQWIHILMFYQNKRENL